MKKLILILLVVVLLIMTVSIALAKPRQKMDLICWTNNKGQEQSAYFKETGSGIIHRFKLDGKHDVYKPATMFDMSGDDAWELWEGKLQDPCVEQSPVSFNDYLEVGVWYWHNYN